MESFESKLKLYPETCQTCNADATGVCEKCLTLARLGGWLEGKWNPLARDEVKI